MEQRSFWYRFFGHLHTINKHRFIVLCLCFKCGMYYQGLVHDLSKYSPSEFIPSVKYFQGNRSPISREKEVIGYSECWLHHKGRNKHHFEYWLDRKGKTTEIYAYPMPFRYVLESIMDKISASKVYNKDIYTDSTPYDWFMNSMESKCVNEVNAKQFEHLLLYLKENGEEKALKYYKSLYKKYKNEYIVTL